MVLKRSLFSEGGSMTLPVEFLGLSKKKFNNFVHYVDIVKNQFLLHSKTILLVLKKSDNDCTLFLGNFCRIGQVGVTEPPLCTDRVNGIKTCC